MHNSVPVVIRGQSYRSMAEAARHLNVTKSAVFMAVERGTLDKIGVPVGKAVVIRGVTYTSAVEAARQLRVTPKVVYAAKSRGTLDRVGLRAKEPRQ